MFPRSRVPHVAIKPADVAKLHTFLNLIRSFKR